MLLVSPDFLSGVLFAYTKNRFKNQQKKERDRERVGESERANNLGGFRYDLFKQKTANIELIDSGFVQTFIIFFSEEKSKFGNFKFKREKQFPVLICYHQERERTTKKVKKQI